MSFYSCLSYCAVTHCYELICRPSVGLYIHCLNSCCAWADNVATHPAVREVGLLHARAGRRRFDRSRVKIYRRSLHGFAIVQRRRSPPAAAAAAVDKRNDTCDANENASRHIRRVRRSRHRSGDTRAHLPRAVFRSAAPLLCSRYVHARRRSLPGRVAASSFDLTPLRTCLQCNVAPLLDKYIMIIMITVCLE